LLSKSALRDVFHAVSPLALLVANVFPFVRNSPRLGSC
jgi:hypothetical protein